MKPDLSFENELWEKGFEFVGGMDEVGRGAFAGPVIAGCVIFGKNLELKSSTSIIINDSKKLTQKQREVASIWIKENCLSWGIGSASVAEINKFGIVKATNIAFRKAVLNTQIKVDHLLIDAFYIPFVKGLRRKNQTPIVKGDNLSVSIAAASIIAKVYRDRLMRTHARNSKYKVYGWERNKGYGTKEHQKAIQKYGICRLHRQQFTKKLV